MAWVRLVADKNEILDCDGEYKYTMMLINHLKFFNS